MVRSPKQDEKQPQFPDTQELWDVPKVAQFFGIPTRQVYDLVKQGQIPCDRFGRHIRFHPGIVKRWSEDRQRLQPAVEPPQQIA